jgi:long-subunit fatty acid transport protein
LQPVAPLPDIKSRLNRLSLSLDYRHRDDITYRVGYAYERYRTDDFAVDNVAHDTISDVLGLGQDSPDYSVHVIGASVQYRF